MNNFDLHEQAQQLADTRSAYSLARELLELREGIASMQRYTLGGHCDSFGQDCGAEMEKDDDGEYVMLTDVLALAAAK
jgi:hypothetical protein